MNVPECKQRRERVCPNRCNDYAHLCCLYCKRFRESTFIPICSPCSIGMDWWKKLSKIEQFVWKGKWYNEED